MTETEELELLLRVIDDGLYWLEVIPGSGMVELVAHPSAGGESLDDVELYRLPVLREELGLAPGQTWPERWNLGRRHVALPFAGDDYEARLGDALAMRVLHVLTMAQMAEWKGVTQDGVIWRDANPGVIDAWEAANDRAVILALRLRMSQED